jgi:polyisoprenoid-binding protein YceI
MRRSAASILGFALILAAMPAGGAEFRIRSGDGTRVVFESKAPMESFKGKTNRVEGRILVSPPSAGDSVTVDVEVDLASLDTGIRMRNRHMREKHLETDRYPKAIFHGATVLDGSAARLDPGKKIVLTIEGTFTLHGVSRRLRAPVEVVYEPKGEGGRIRFETTFSVSLEVHQISRPQFLFLKLADVQQVTVTGVAVAP